MVLSGWYHQPLRLGLFGRKGEENPLLSTFTSSLDSLKCIVLQRIPALGQVLLGAGDRDRTGMFSLEG